MDKIRLLLVEDHQFTLDGLVQGLSSQPDFEIVGSCMSSEEGMDIALDKHPDVIILDLHLPGKWAPTEMLRQFLTMPSSKLIVLSAEQRQAYVQMVLGMGVSAYLVKSERLSMVADTIRKVMVGRDCIVSEALGKPTKITPSEQEVLHLLAKGLKYQDIADMRSTSVATSKKQCEILILKLDLESREQLIAWAVQNGYGFT
jgi:NarL family two-component system response regulator LiaR